MIVRKIYVFIIIFLAHVSASASVASAKATVIIPGISGDLSKRKLIPALYQLFKQGAVGLIIGTGRRDLAIKTVFDAAKPFIANYNEKTAQAMLDITFYQKFDPKKPDDEKILKRIIEEKQARYGLAGPRIVYLSVPSETFCDLTKSLVVAKIIKKGDPLHRIAYEKPFGQDRASARAILQCLQQYVKREQVFLVDHYRAKSMVMAIPSLFASNSILKRSLSADSIAQINIFFDETIGIEGRGEFYDRYGAIKDVLQNHMLQMLAVLATPGDTRTNPRGARKQACRRAEFLRSLRGVQMIRGQYHGYTAEKDVDPDSNTETYGAATFLSNATRWNGVPFFLRTGKKLARKLTEIEVLFKSQNPEEKSALILTISPYEQIKLDLAVQGKTIELLAEQGKPREAYETIFEHLIAGTHDIDVTYEEIDAQWRLIEDLHAEKIPLKHYAPGSNGLPMPPVPLQSKSVRPVGGRPLINCRS